MESAELPPILKFSVANASRGLGSQTGIRGAPVPAGSRAHQHENPKASGASIISLLCFTTIDSGNLQSLGSIKPEDRLLEWLSTIPRPACQPGQSAVKEEGAAQAAPLKVSHYVCPSNLRPVSPAKFSVPRHAANTRTARYRAETSLPACPAISKSLGTMSPTASIGILMRQGSMPKPPLSPNLLLDDRHSWPECCSPSTSEHSRSITVSVISTIDSGALSWLHGNALASESLSDGMERSAPPHSEDDAVSSPNTHHNPLNRMMLKRRAEVFSAIRFAHPDDHFQRLHLVRSRLPAGTCSSPILKSGRDWKWFTSN